MKRPHKVLAVAFICLLAMAMTMFASPPPGATAAGNLGKELALQPQSSCQEIQLVQPVLAQRWDQQQNMSMITQPTRTEQAFSQGNPIAANTSPPAQFVQNVYNPNDIQDTGQATNAENTSSYKGDYRASAPQVVLRV